MKMLHEIKVGDTCIVEKILAIDDIRERLSSIGVTNGLIIEVLRRGPKNNLTVYNNRGVMIALRKEESSLILVSWDGKWNLLDFLIIKDKLN